MTWPNMRNSAWYVLQAFYESPGPITWDPGDTYAHAAGKVYTVMPVALTAPDMPQNASNKENVVFTVEIRTVVS